MKEYSFAADINQRIVDGILHGYKNYIRERNEKRNLMKISDAYAWVKGNHIDDQTATYCEEVGISYKKAKAGYTWGYLQFSSLEERSMFIIKNAKYFNIENVPGGKGIKGNKQKSAYEDNYLRKLSKINTKINFPEKHTLFSGHQDILSIFDDSVMKSLEQGEEVRLQQEYDKFYIVTYEIDEAFMISKIQVWMPNPATNEAHEVEDLTRFVDISPIDFMDIDTSVLENDHAGYDNEIASIADYGIVHDNQIIQNEKGDNKS
ncbi:hypothetical protein AB1L05_09180 [Cytobacillus horneckiae]|uniref:spr1630 family ClpXP-sensitive toxin n=1 Tax=Cytobacillus horneckiae TaxID=549687 RepID=UPI0039A00F90